MIEKHIGFVPVTRTINGKPLTGDITLSMNDFTDEMNVIAMGNAILQWSGVEKNATYGADWDADLENIPVNLAALGDLPGYITATKITSTTIESPTIASNATLTGTLIASSGSSNTAGMTGETSGDDAIRIWAGDTYANRATAPFRVTQGGAVVATNIALQTSAIGKRVTINEYSGSAYDNEIHFYETAGERIRIGSDVDGLGSPGIVITSGIIEINQNSISSIYAITTSSTVGNGIKASALGANGIALKAIANNTGSLAIETSGDCDFDGALTVSGNINTEGQFQVDGLPLDYSDVGAAAATHNLIDTTYHPVSGLTAGHFLKALSGTTYGFAAHGLVASDVGVAFGSLNVSGVYAYKTSGGGTLYELKVAPLTIGATTYYLLTDQWV